MIHKSFLTLGLLAIIFLNIFSCSNTKSRILQEEAASNEEIATTEEKQNTSPPEDIPTQDETTQNTDTSEEKIEEIEKTKEEEKTEDQKSNTKKPLSDADQDKQLKEMMLKNVKVWTSILLVIIAAYALFIISTMEIPKNTLLYATYVTSKSDKIN